MRWSPLFLLLSAFAGACGARTPLPANHDDSIMDPGVIPRHLAPADKIDLLFMIDNSASMADKQALLKEAVPDLVSRLVNPRCVAASDPNKVVGTSAGGTCTLGVPEFPAVHDLHVAIVTSSLGGRGSDSCQTQPNPTNPLLDAHMNDNGHLIMRGGRDERPIPDGSPSNFLAWFPPSGTNQNGDRPAVTPIQDPARFAADFQDLVAGVHEYGCGFEAQLESWYRFLVQPDPYAEIVVQDGRARLVGIDEVILKQRHDFLRPDSLVAIILLTDENDSTVDPLSVNRSGWAFENTTFPGSSGGGAPRATGACAVDPSSHSCTSCAFGSKNDPACFVNGGYYTRQEDPTNVRFFHMKQRFGVDPQFPMQRYVDALTSAIVPNRNGEYPNDAADYVGKKNCGNPLFSKNLPKDAKGELCLLDHGPRPLDFVYFAIIGGVPNDLLHFDPSRPDKSRLTDADWLRLVGRDPSHYDFEGIDPHMLESITPRAGLPGVGASNTADPISGREWDTKGGDLQYACIFPLASPRDCEDAPVASGCDCASKPSPLCDTNRPKTQVRGKAYPPVRQLLVARALNDQGIVASLCPIHALPVSEDDPLYGYRPAMKSIIDRLKLGLE